MAVPHLILTEAKFIWTQREVEKFRALWEVGLSIYEIAEQMNEDPDDIALLVIDQAKKGKIRHANEPVR